MLSTLIKHILPTPTHTHAALPLFLYSPMSTFVVSPFNLGLHADLIKNLNKSFERISETTNTSHICFKLPIHSQITLLTYSRKHPTCI